MVAFYLAPTVAHQLLHLPSPLRSLAQAATSAQSLLRLLEQSLLFQRNWFPRGSQPDAENLFTLDLCLIPFYCVEDFDGGPLSLGP